MQEETKKIGKLYGMPDIVRTGAAESEGSPERQLGELKKPRRLYQHMQKNFEENVLKKEEQEREFKLKEHRNKHGPVTQSDIEVHQ